jgi:hypothetical protein
VNNETPVPARFKIVRPDDNIGRVDSNLQERCRSGMGMLLFLIEHSRYYLLNIENEFQSAWTELVPQRTNRF